MFKRIEKRKIYGTILGILIFTILLFSVTYAYYLWSSTDTQKTNVNLTLSKGLEGKIVYNAGNSILSSDNASLTLGSDYSSGISTTIEFWKNAAVTKTIYGQLSMKILDLQNSSSVSTDATNIASTSTVKWAITTFNVNNSSETLLSSGTFLNKKIGDVFTLVTNIELNNYQTFYKVYIWLDQNAVDTTKMVTGELISTLISAEATDVKYRYDIKLDNSGANYPELKSNMIPVVYDEDDDVWVKADTEGVITENADGTTSMSSYVWYDYSAKKWANVAYVDSNSYNTYKNATAGTEIPTSVIRAFYVWIPRFKYKVWNLSKTPGADSYNAQTTGIDIVFEDGTSTTGTITCTYRYNVDTSNGGINLSNDLAETCSANGSLYYTHPAFRQNNTEIEGFWVSKYKTQNDGITSLPNESIFTSVFYTGDFPNILILSNLEYGAIAYLSYSNYGDCSVGYCNGSINATSNTGTGLSTTGNIYGVFDMIGSSMGEYVSSYVSDSATTLSYSHMHIFMSSGYQTYYAYNTSSTTSSISRLGDGMVEAIDDTITPVYVSWDESDEENYGSTFPTVSSPYLIRGKGHSMFNFTPATVYSEASFRVVIH